jgi:hypothetical protein
MIVLGYKYIPSPVFMSIKKIDDIKLTPDNSILYIVFEEFNIKLIDYCSKNSLLYAIKVSNLKELVIANYYNATYIMVDSKLINEAQQFANDYLIDSKILLVIDKEEQIEFCAKKAIDGVVFRDFIS